MQNRFLYLVFKPEKQTNPVFRPINIIQQQQIISRLLSSFFEMCFETPCNPSSLNGSYNRMQSRQQNKGDNKGVISIVGLGAPINI